MSSLTNEMKCDKVIEWDKVRHDVCLVLVRREVYRELVK